MLTAFVGGTRDPDFVQADPQTLTARVLDDLRVLLGAQGEPTFRALQVWPKAIPQYVLGYGRFKDIADEVRAAQSRIGAGGYVPGRCVARRGHRFGRAGRNPHGRAPRHRTGDGRTRPPGPHRFHGGAGLSPRRSALRIGTRGSTLAVWQTEWVRALLRDSGYQSERIEIKTTGDLVADVPLARIGSRALFTKQIDDALLEGRIDLAVHSFKDLPTQLPTGSPWPQSGSARIPVTRSSDGGHSSGMVCPAVA